MFLNLIPSKECQVPVSHFQLFEFIVTKNDKHTVHVSEEASTEEWTSIHAIFFVLKSRPCHTHAFEEASAWISYLFKQVNTKKIFKHIFISITM